MVVVHNSTDELPTVQNPETPPLESPELATSPTSMFGKPGQYEIIMETLILEAPNENAEEVRLVEVGDIVTVTEVAVFEGQILGRVDGGWLTIRDDFFEFYARPVIHLCMSQLVFGQPGQYRLQAPTAVTLERDLQSLELRVAEVGEILEITHVETFAGVMRGQFFQGWVTLRSDQFDVFADIIGELPEEETHYAIAEFGHPGKYIVIQDAVCTASWDPTSREVSIVLPDEVHFVSEVKEFEDSLRARIEDGWICVRNALFEYFAKPHDPDDIKEKKKARIPMIYTHSTFNLNNGWFKIAKGTDVYKSIDGEVMHKLHDGDEINIMTRNGKWGQITSPVQGFIKLVDDHDKVVLREIDFPEASEGDESEEESSDVIIGGEVGHPGMYEITSVTPLNVDLDPESVELKTLEVGDVVNVEVLSNFEGFIRGKTEDGWFSLRDDVFQEFAKPAIHTFGEPGDYVLLEDVITKHGADPDSAQLRLILENETARVKVVTEIKGHIRGECEYGWISLQDDTGKKYARVKTSASDVPDDTEMGDAGKYCLVQDGVLTRYRDPDSEELCVIPEGTTIRVVTVKDVEDTLRGKVQHGDDMGWLTLRDDVFEVFAKPKNETEEMEKDKQDLKVRLADYSEIGGDTIQSDYSLPDIQNPPPTDPMTPPPDKSGSKKDPSRAPTIAELQSEIFALKVTVASYETRMSKLESLVEQLVGEMEKTRK